MCQTLIHDCYLETRQIEVSWEASALCSPVKGGRDSDLCPVLCSQNLGDPNGCLSPLRLVLKLPRVFFLNW